MDVNLKETKVSKVYVEYWKLRRMYKLYKIYKKTNDKLGPSLKLYRQLIKEKGMSIEQVVNAVEIAIHKVPYMESLYKQVKDEVNKLQNTIEGLLKNIDALKYKISILDKIAFSCEQDCKRTKQQLQELIDKKDRIEKWITNILNNDEIKQIVKENVKAVLSNNKILISTAFAAIIQTVTSDPKMINIIYKILTVNDGKQHKNNNDNAIKYLEINKNSLSDLAEKHYENIVQALTNNAIDAAASNPTLLLPQSSSTFPNPFDQNNIYRIEESGYYHNSKGDIAD